MLEQQWFEHPCKICRLHLYFMIFIRNKVASLQLTEGVCVDEVILACEGHPLAGEEGAGEQLHAVHPGSLGRGQRVPVGVARGAAAWGGRHQAF